MAARIDDALLLADLQWVARELERQTLTTGEYAIHGRYSFTTIFHRFGWVTALRKAGLKPTPSQAHRDIPDATFLADLRRVARKIGEVELTTKSYTAYGRYTSTALANRFGSWRTALTRAGLRPPFRKNIPAADLLADLKRVTRRLGKRTITHAEYDASGGRYNSRTIAKRLDSWPKALRAAGLELSSRWKRYQGVTRAALLTDLRKVARELGKRTVKVEEYAAHGRYFSSMFVRRFGSWVKALSMAGLESTLLQAHRRISRATLLADLRRVARMLGKRTLIAREYDAHGKYSSVTLKRRFGGWEKALRKAGLEGKAPFKITTVALLADLQRVARELGKQTVTVGEYVVSGKYALGTIQNRLGRWTEALAAAGLNPGRVRNASRPVLLADLRRVARMLGKRTMMAKEYRRLGRFSVGTFRARFKRWSIALVRAGLRPLHRMDIPDDELLADLRRTAQRLRKQTLTTEEYNAHGKFSPVTFMHRFRSWSRALLAAGLQPTVEQIVKSRTHLRSSLRAIATIPGLTAEDRVKVAKTMDGVKDLGDEVVLQLLRRMNLGPMELPSGIPNGVPFLERCIAALQKVQPDPEKLRATGVLERLGRQLHRAVALELLGREPLSPAEEQRVARELQQRKAA